MKRLIFAVPLVLLFACGSSDESTENPKVETSESNDDTTSTVVAEAPPFDPNSIEENVYFENTPFNGEQIQSIGWTDNRGQNVIILSIEYEEIDQYMSAYIYANHYADETGEMKLVRQVTDYVRDCEFDIILEFLEDPIITDIDGNDRAEVTLVYKMACKSDMSEDDLKVIMYEDDQKWGLRGYNWLVYGEETVPEEFDPNMENTTKEEQNDWMFERGKYKNDDDFKNAPEGFLEHAQKVWLDNCFEVY